MPTKIIVKDNKQCQLVTDDPMLFQSTRAFLSFKAVGVEYTPAYQQGWDGITYLLTKKGVFRAGLLNRVKQYLQDYGAEFLVDDVRTPAKSNTPIDLTDRLKQLNLVPRDYQEQIVKACLNNSKGIVRSATGSGKTLSTALLTAQFNKPTIIYVIGLDLLQQFHDLFSKIFDEPIGFIGNGVCQIHRINIASIWTIGKALKLDKADLAVNDEDMTLGAEKDPSDNDTTNILHMLQATKLHIFDESHIITTNTILQIYNAIDPENIYGFSGTPFRDDNTNLLIHSILGEKIIDVGASELIKRGILAQPVIKFVTVPKASKVGQTYQEVYKNYIVDNEVRNQLIVQQLQELLDKKYTPLVLFKQIRHGNILLELVEAAGIKCAMLYGDDSLARRAEVKESLLSGKIDVILASTVFDIGVDVPKLSAIVLCGGGRSSIRALQRIGRGARMYPGKKFCAVVDFYDQAKFLKEHSKIRYNIYRSEEGFRVHIPNIMKQAVE